MNLAMDSAVAAGYKSGAQIARRVTEDWCVKNLYCAACTADTLAETPPNTKAFDFCCGGCGARYQLKAGARRNEQRVPDAAYDSMVQAIRSDATPNLLVLHYTPAWVIQNLVLIPSFFFSESCIEKRKALSSSARRAGWVGCNIILTSIAPEGKLPMVHEGRALEATWIRERYKYIRSLSGLKPERRGWTLDVLRCVRSLNRPSFDLADLYDLEPQIAALYPDNSNVRAKIRQQLQVLRDIGLIRFLGRGKYELLHLATSPSIRKLEPESA